jgi:hypothetical protein
MGNGAGCHLRSPFSRLIEANSSPSTERRSTPAKGDTRKENNLGRFLGGDADNTLSLSIHLEFGLGPKPPGAYIIQTYGEI